MSEYVTLNVWPKTKELFGEISCRYNLSRAKLMHLMCEFFINNNISPLDKAIDKTSNASVKSAKEMVERQDASDDGDDGMKVKKSDKDIIIGFMRVQETKFLAPTEKKINFIMEKMSYLVAQKSLVEGETIKKEVEVEKEGSKEQFSSKDRFYQLKDHVMMSSFLLAGDRTLELLAKVKNKKNILGKTILEIEGDGYGEVMALIEMLEQNKKEYKEEYVH